MIHFIGKSYAAVTLQEAARRRGLKLTFDMNEADLIFVSEDTPTDVFGKRDLEKIYNLVHYAVMTTTAPIVLTSQVPPGYTRSLTEISRADGSHPEIYHQAETLRIEDGIQRAMFPEMFIVGWESPDRIMSIDYLRYLEAFDCPILNMTYEEAEFCKMAINATLISQVENTNYLSKVANKIGADWSKVSKALRHDSRIGKYSYLTPGRWQDSKHLYRDAVTLHEILEK